MYIYIYTHTQLQHACNALLLSQRENGVDRVKGRELRISLMMLKTNARLDALTAVWYLVMISKNCLQEKSLGIKKAALLLLKSTKNSGRKCFELSVLCGIRVFLSLPCFLPFQIPFFLYLGGEHFATCQVAHLQFMMTSVFPWTNYFVVLCRRWCFSLWWAV